MWVFFISIPTMASFCAPATCCIHLPAKAILPKSQSNYSVLLTLTETGHVSVTEPYTLLQTDWYSVVHNQKSINVQWNDLCQ